MTAPSVAVYTPEQLAERWNCPVRQVNETCASKKVRAFKVGRHWRVTANALADYESAAPDAVSSQPVTFNVRRRRAS